MPFVSLGFDDCVMRVGFGDVGAVCFSAATAKLSCLDSVFSTFYTSARFERVT